MRYIQPKSVALLLAAILALVPLGCKLSPNKVGKLVGVSVQMPMSEAMSGHVNNMEYLGTVSVQLDDKTVVDAVCDRTLMQTLRGGQKLEIEPLGDKDKGKWKVVRAVDSSPW